MDLLIPHACPELPIGPVSLVKGHQGPYVARHGALPPHWGEARRHQFDNFRDDAVMIMHRSYAPPKTLEAARIWLYRHGLDARGRPLIWSATRETTSTFTLVG